MAVLLWAGNAYASLIIDSFNVAYNSQPLFMLPGGPASFDMKTGPTSDIIGGSRDTVFEYKGGSGISYTTANLSSSGTLDFAQGPATSAKLTLLWDGDTTLGLNAYALNANLTSDGSTGFLADMKNIDLPIAFRVEVYTNATNSSEFNGTFTGGPSGAGLQYLDFSQFSVLSGSGANFGNVGAIKFIIDGTNYPDTDLSIGSIATGVPEPATFVFMLYGLMGLGFHTYCRRGKI
jgi:hypothetical protein